MSHADTLIENLRKAKANLVCAKEQAEKAENAYETAQDQLIAARDTHSKALSAIEVAASNNE